MEQNIAFQRCVDFLARMIKKYGDELFAEIQKSEEDQEQKGKAS